MSTQKGRVTIYLKPKFILHGLLVYLLLVGAAVGDAGWYAPRLLADSRTGLPEQIVAPSMRDANILVAPTTFLLREDGKDIPVPAARLVAPGVFAMTLPERDLTMEIRYGTDGLPYLEWMVESKSGKTGNLSATFYLSLHPSADRAFFPAGEKPRSLLEQGKIPITYSYGDGSGTRTAMPLGQVYCSAEDWGLAFFGEFGELIENLSTTISRTDKSVRVAITLSIPRSAMGQTSRRLYFASTRGDWRPALAAVLARFPKAFEPHNPNIAFLHGPFVNSIGTPSDTNIKDWYTQGARVVEIHGTFPFYGQYVAQDKVWTPLSDDIWHSLKKRLSLNRRPRNDASWQEIKRFVGKQHPPQMTVAKVNDYIDRLHRHGMKGLIYFNPTEAWAPWATAHFPSDRRLTPEGKMVPAWYESVGMIPDKQRPWGRYLLGQIRDLLHLYPLVDGIFFDQSTMGGHDLTELCAEACLLMRANGKICWWNGPYNMELAALADGMMTEKGGSEIYREVTEIVQYYGLAGKPIVSLGEPTDAGYAEMLVHGIVPQPVSKSRHEMAERWSPLFSWLRNRRWILEANALDTTPGVQANLFRVPDGNLVVPVVPESFPIDKPMTLFDVGVTVRVSDADEVRGVYLLAPDLLGYHKLPFAREGNALRITLPRLGSAGLLVLAKTGIFPALEGGMNLVRGREEMLRWVVDNWTAEPMGVSLEVSSFLSQKRIVGQAASWASMVLEVPVKIPAKDGDSRLEMAASAKIEGEEKAGKAELWVDPPLSLAVVGSANARDDAVYLLVVRLLGHLSTGTVVDLKATSRDWQFEATPDHVVLKPDIPVVVEIRGRPLNAGKTLIRIAATATDDSQVSAQTEIPVQVLATAINPSGLNRVRSADLLFDVFGVDRGAYVHKPVSINGVQLGDLPQGNGDQWTRDMVVPLSRAAIKALRPHNEIAIDNQVNDAFKVRNFRLLLHMRDGSTVVSATDTGVYTGGMGWLYGEGKQFSFGQPLTGIAMDIRFDANQPIR